MNRDIFFQHIRRDPFSGGMTPSQVAGINALLGAWNPDLDVRWLAYVLATVFHETAARMQPVREGLKSCDKEARAYVKRQGYAYAEPDPVTGEVYYGRGHVQLTWAKNYKAMGEALGLNLYYKPDMALDPAISSRILLLGMTNGLYTGKKLADYFNARTDNPVGARRIVNGTDRAGLIAGYHHAFLAAIQAANGEAVDIEPPERETPAPRYPEERKPLATSKTIIGSGIATAGTTVGAVVDQIKPDDVPISQDVLEAVQASQEAVSYTMGLWEWAGIVCAVLAIVGIGIVLWSKYDRRKRGIE